MYACSSPSGTEEPYSPCVTNICWPWKPLVVHFRRVQCCHIGLYAYSWLTNKALSPKSARRDRRVVL